MRFVCSALYDATNTKHPEVVKHGDPSSWWTLIEAADHDAAAQQFTEQSYFESEVRDGQVSHIVVTRWADDESIPYATKVYAVKPRYGLDSLS